MTKIMSYAGSKLADVKFLLKSNREELLIS